MSDIRNFTAVAESLSPEETIGMLNHYFSHMIEVVHRHKGIIVDFCGDGLLAFFDPHDGPVLPAAARALQCSLAMQKSMYELKRDLENNGLPPLKIGIGVHTGPVVVGNIGSSLRVKYGIVGLAVNVAQRIQEKAEGGQIIVSEEFYNILADRLTVEKSFRAQFKGVQGASILYVVRGVSEP
jgi:class 3 adenylate cyclase